MLSEIVLNSQHTYFPAAQDSLDSVVGLLRGRDWLARLVTQQPAEMWTFLQSALDGPETQTILDELGLFTESGQMVALVIGEFGGLLGRVTITDVLEALVGDWRRPERRKSSCAVTMPFTRPVRVKGCGLCGIGPGCHPGWQIAAGAEMQVGRDGNGDCGWGNGVEDR